MPRHRPYALLLAGAVLLLSACERTKTSPFAAEFAVQIPALAGSNGDLSREGYVVVLYHALTSTELSGDSLRELSGGGPRTGPPVTIKLDFTVEHHRVITTVYSLPSETDPLRYSEGHKRYLGVHSARLNETVELKELERLGYPLILKIVAARPDHPIPPSIISEVPSIQTRVVNEDRNGYTLLLRNVSLRGVVSYAIYQGEGISLSSISRRQFLIAPEGERYVRIDQVSREIVIVAALFNDGSHEGEPAAALKLKSDQIGYETQEGRAIPMIDRLIRDPALDDVIRLARIKDGLSKLSSEPDDTAMRIMQSQFPDLPVDLVRKELRDAFYSARVNLWSEVYGYAHSSGEYPPPVHPPPLADFLRQRQ